MERFPSIIALLSLTGFANLSAQEVVVTNFHTTDPIQPAVSRLFVPGSLQNHIAVACWF